MVSLNSLKSQASDVKHGAYTIFVKLKNGRVGVKLFLSKEDRDIAFMHQCKAYKCKLGPRAIKTFEFYDSDFDTEFYCYTTEVVKTLADKPFTDNVRRRIDALMCDLEIKMADAGLNPWDIHRKNVGISQGELICIDFGSDESVSRLEYNRKVYFSI